MPAKPEILKRTPECQSRLFRVESLALRFSNGEERVFERLAGGLVPAVIVVPMLDERRVILVREYGAGIDDYHVSLPKGRVDPGETLLEGANRELMEEVGYGARRLTLLKCLTQAPNYQPHSTQIVLAEDLYPEKREGDEPEPLEPEVLDLDDLEQWLTRADITEARTIAALYLTRAHLRRRNAGEFV